MRQQTIGSLLKSGKWMIRFDNDGQSYNGFQWQPIGQWTTPPDWNPLPQCGNGLHGQNPRGHGYCQPNSRLVLCRISKCVVIDGDKVKTDKAQILAVNEAIPAIFLTTVSLHLRGYQHPLPAGLASVGGYLYLGGYQHPGARGDNLRTAGLIAHENTIEYALTARHRHK